jgi:hypothetical protein
MKNAGKMIRRDEVEFFLRRHGLWEGVLSLPPPPVPPFDIESSKNAEGSEAFWTEAKAKPKPAG